MGFPGETEADFEETLQLVERVNYAQAYSFAYSPRPGTPAAALSTQVDESVKKDRLYRLQALLNQQQVDFNQSFLGTTIPVLFERRGKEENQYLGKSPHMQSVHVISNDDMIGQVRLVKVKATFANCLKGDIVST